MANVRFKLRNFQNEKWAGKNRLKQFLWVELAWMYRFSSVNDKERGNLVTWYKLTFAVNAMINLSNVENWLWQQWSSCIYSIRICPKALNLTEYKTVDGKSGFYYFSFIQYLNNFSTLLSFPSIFPEISKNSMLFFSADCYKSECIVRISLINVIKTLNVSRKEGGGRAINS